MKKLLTVILMLLLLFALVSCSLEIRTAKFIFDISLDNFKLRKAEDLYFSDVDMVSFDITVTTTCTSGRYKYTSTVTPGFDGGIPTIILPDGSEIKNDPVEKAMGYDEVDIRKGDNTERIWRFTVPTDFVWGEYDIRVECDNGQTKIFENVLIEYKE